jgi:predicted CopG family antitoxin
MKVHDETYNTLCRMKNGKKPNGEVITFDDVIGFLINNQKPVKRKKMWVDNGPAFYGFRK